MGIIKGIKIESIEAPKLAEVKPFERPVIEVRVENSFPLVGKGLSGDLAEAGVRLGEMTITPHLGNSSAIQYSQETALVPFNAQTALALTPKFEIIQEVEGAGKWAGRLGGFLGPLALGLGAPAVIWAPPTVMGLLMFRGVRQRVAGGLSAIGHSIKNWIDRASLQRSFEKLNSSLSAKVRMVEIQNIRSLADENPALFDQGLSLHLLGNLATYQHPDLIDVMALLISKGNKEVSTGLISTMTLWEFNREGLRHMFFRLLEVKGPLANELLEKMIHSAIEVEAFHSEKIFKQEQTYRQETKDLREATAWTAQVSEMRKAYNLRILNQTDFILEKSGRSWSVVPIMVQEEFGLFYPVGENDPALPKMIDIEVVDGRIVAYQPHSVLGTLFE